MEKSMCDCVSTFLSISLKDEKFFKNDFDVTKLLSAVMLSHEHYKTHPAHGLPHTARDKLRNFFMNGFSIFYPPFGMWDYKIIYNITTTTTMNYFPPLLDINPLVAFHIFSI